MPSRSRHHSAHHRETHRTTRINWLRAAVLGANDGIVSTASLLVGMASAQTPSAALMLAGVAALVAGAMSMAAGEYVSVSSQHDTEQADLNRERRELATQPEHEHAELAGIYVQRGLSPALADQVATQLMAHDALGAHARDELGITVNSQARPIQAALASAAAFSAGAVVPLAVAALTPGAQDVPVIAGVSLLSLSGLGLLSASIGGAPLFKATVRVTLWGALAMALTAGVGHLFGAVS